MVLEDNKEEPAYNHWDSRDEEALAQGDISESKKKTITRRQGVGRAKNAREMKIFLGEVIVI